MKVAILGPGNVGRSLGHRALQAGHEIVLGVRSPDSASARSASALLAAARICEFHEAAMRADLALLTVPWAAAEEVVASLPGGIVVDCTNPVAPGLRHALGDRSGAEVLAASNPAIHAVKAFNVYGVEILGNPDFGDESGTLPIAGDDPGAKARVAELARSMGWDALDVGPLALALQLEHLALLWIHMVRAQGQPSSFAWKQLVRPNAMSGGHDA